MQLLAGYLTAEGSEESVQVFAIAGHNPLIAYINIICIILFCVLGIVHFYKQVRQIKESQQILGK